MKKCLIIVVCLILAVICVVAICLSVKKEQSIEGDATQKSSTIKENAISDKNNENNKETVVVDKENDESDNEEIEEVEEEIIELYVFSNKNDSIAKIDDGFKIYSDGTIEVFDNINNKVEKVGKLNNSDLNKLKGLSESITENYGNVVNQGSNMGECISKIYNTKEEKWITVYKAGNELLNNECKEAKEIKEFMSKVKNQYMDKDE